MSLHTFCRRICLLTALAILLLSVNLALPRPVQAAPSGLTYLGQLLIGGVAANGSYDFQFKLYDAATGGTQVGSTVSLSAVPVAQGLYSASLFFGTGVITGQTLWLQISYRPHPSSGNPPYTTITPRSVAPNSAFADYAQLSGSTAALQGKPISTTAPTTGQVLQWNGSLWTPATVAGGGGATLSLPLTQSVSSSSDLFTLTNTGSGRAIVGNSSSNTAVKGVGKNGVYGQGTNYGVQASGTNYGVYSISPAVGVYGSGTGSSGTGVYGIGGTSGYGTEGVYGAATGLAASGRFYYSGVLGDTTTGNGVIGSTTASGGYGVAGITGTNGSAGVYGSTASTSGIGVEGLGGSYGVYGNGSSYGLFGTGASAGVYGSGGTYGVYGYDYNNGTYGILGSVSNSGYDTGVIGESEGTTTYKVGVEGISQVDNGLGIWGVGDTSKSGNYAGYFTGNVYVSGTLSKAGGSFKIDDPLDPAHKTLSHSFVESPDMKNIYDGTVTLDANGAATVTMPKWFGALNQDFRYQLTAIGAPGPNLYIAQKVKNNQFQIAGGQPGAEVSWQVTGTRHDAWANANRIPTEEDKPAELQGKYLNPEAFGLPASMGVHPVRSGGAPPQSAPKPPVLPAQQR